MSPLSFAAITVVDLDASISFYRDVIGFDVVARGRSQHSFNNLLSVDPEILIETALLRACHLEIGRILLLHIHAPHRQQIRCPGDRMIRGLWNLNFYVDDIRDTARWLSAAGYEFWSDPVEYEISAETGSPIEVIFEAPDGVAINLVQPQGDETTFVGRIRAQADAFGRTRTGFTPVATTGHCVHSMDQASPFYSTLLDLEIVMDERLGKPETNHFLSRPRDARARTVFLAGGHFFGKLGLNEPLNFDVPERVLNDIQTNIGYVAQGFFVNDLDASCIVAQRLGGVPFGSVSEMGIAGFSNERAALFRAPGSGALAWLVERPQSV